MDLSSMLNNDDAKPPPVPSAPVDANEPPPRPVKSEPSTTPAPAPLDGQPRDQMKDESSLPRKRQRVEDSPSPKTTGKPPAPTNEKATVAASVSPQQSAKVLAAQSPSRSNSIVATIPRDGEVEMEPSITNILPSEELTRFISDFIFVNLNEEGLHNLEIEAKLGRIIDVNTNDRIRLPVQTETAIVSDTSEFNFHTRFESNMTEKQHKTFNEALNKAYLASRSPSNGATPSKHRRIPIEYTHTKQLDSTYAFPGETSRLAQKIRVSTNAQGEVLDTITKENMGHLNIYSPRTAFDWRISINNERKVVLPQGVELKSERRKDRLTYIHQHCQIDLTQVTHPDSTKTHELEVELRDIEALQVEAENAKEGKASKYADMVRVFVDNVRLLARAREG